MSDSILSSTKLQLGLEPSENHFDEMLMDYINTSLAELHQVGVNNEPFFISTGEESWGDFVADPFVQNLCRTYVNKSVKTMFDPSPSSAMEQATQEICNRLLFRIHVAVDPENSL